MFVCKKISPVFIFASAFLLLLPALISAPHKSAAVSLFSPVSADVPVLMYHSIADRPSHTGDYLILPQVFRSDMQYLKDCGYTTVTSAEVYDYAANGTPLPDKPVIITFDDGFLNNMTYALPVFEELDMCGTVNIVGSYSVRSAEYNDPNPDYAYLTAEEIRSLAESGRFEIGSHTYDMHSFGNRKGCRKNRQESVEDYTAAFSSDCRLENEYLLNECGIVTDVFAYPYGFISQESIGVLKEYGYKILFTCCERHNNIEPYSITDGEVLFLDRYNRPSGISTENFMKNAGII